jgi:hypothetical protein
MNDKMNIYKDRGKTVTVFFRSVAYVWIRGAKLYRSQGHFNNVSVMFRDVAMM